MREHPPAPGLGRHVHDRKEVGECGAVLRRQHHHHLAAFRARRGFDLGLGLHLVAHLEQKLHAELLVRHFAAAEAHRDLDPVAFLEEAVDRLHLGFVVVGVDVGPELDLLDLDHLLALARLGGLLLRGILEAPEIEELGDRRSGIGGDDRRGRGPVPGPGRWRRGSSPRLCSRLRHRSAERRGWKYPRWTAALPSGAQGISWDGEWQLSFCRQWAGRRARAKIVPRSGRSQQHRPRCVDDLSCGHAALQPDVALRQTTVHGSDRDTDHHGGRGRARRGRSPWRTGPADARASSGSAASAPT